MIFLLSGVISRGVEIIAVSGRSDKYKKQTLKFFESNGFEPNELFMRRDGDKRSDVEVKREIYEDNIKDKYNILFVFDDRLQMVRYWVSQGLYVFNCNQHLVEY